jgi:hypothetical protein
MLKQKQLQDWKLLCNEGKPYERGYFYTLFMEITFDDIENIYRYAPNSEKLILKMKNYFLQKEIKFNKGDITPELLEVLIKLDFEEKKELFLAHNEFNELLQKWEFVYIKNYDEVVDMIGDDELSQYFFDYVSDYKINKDKMVYIIYDSLYGLTTDFDFQLYLFEPLLKLKYTGEYMFQFRNLGGIYAITDNVVYYSFK